MARRRVQILAADACHNGVVAYAHHLRIALEGCGRQLEALVAEHERHDP